MPLDPGARIGQYEVKALIGVGGMGEVYRARDTRLKRDVALKVLPAALSRDPERLARFQREAEILASLNHPGIAVIHGLAESGEVRAIVMEFVEGETLPVPVPMDTALDYARQMIEALEYAHDRGVVHRDLKPGNVKVTSEGHTKLLDFGLAKAIEDPLPGTDPAHSPTLTLGHTRAGAIMGTAAYMSPEQAVGKPADRRSDIFSFGAVLYEMLAGQRAFSGGSAPEILASVVKDEPDWSKLPAETPEWLRGLLRRCLVKDRKQRLQAIGEARLVMEHPPDEAGEPFQARRPGRLHYAPWIVAAALALVAGVALWGWLKPTPREPRLVTHFTIPMPQVDKGFEAYTTFAPGPIALSPDGSRLAFVPAPRAPIYIHAMDQLESRPIPGTDGAWFLCFSPDGQWLSFYQDGAVKKLAIAGGPVQVLAPVSASGGPPGTNWLDDGTILYGSGGALMRVASTGGQSEVLLKPDLKAGEAYFTGPQLLPGGRVLLISVFDSNVANARLVALDLKTRQRTQLLETSGVAWFERTDPNSPWGHLLIYDSVAGTLLAAPFHPGRLEIQGAPAPVLEGIQPTTSLFGPFNFSASGTLAYVAGSAYDTPLSTLVLVDRQGVEKPLPAEPRLFVDPNVSPDGSRIKVNIVGNRTVNAAPDSWVYDLSRTTLTRITTGGASGPSLWSRDGKRVIHFSWQGDHSEVWASAADGSGPPQKLIVAERGDAPYLPLSASPDGKTLIGQRPSRGFMAGGPLWALALDQDGAKPQPLLDPQSPKSSATFSPDGRFVAYGSEESGRAEIYVVPWPGPGAKVTISTDGGSDPRWVRNGRELFYRNGDKMMAVDVATTPQFRAGTPRVLFERRYGRIGYDVTPDGRFVMLKPSSGEPAQPNEIHVVQNWFEELRRRVPVK